MLTKTFIYQSIDQFKNDEIMSLFGSYRLTYYDFI